MNGPEQSFADWFRKNYPGPNTIIGNPDWHAPKILRAARYALKAESDARVAAAYEAAAEYVYQQWDDDDAQEHRDAIRALTPADAKAALEQVRRKARAEALREAEEILDIYTGIKMGSSFQTAVSLSCRKAMSAILAHLDKETTE